MGPSGKGGVKVVGGGGGPSRAQDDGLPFFFWLVTIPFPCPQPPNPYSSIVNGMTRRDLLRFAALAPFAGPVSALARLGPSTSFVGLAVFNRIVEKAKAHAWVDLPMSSLMGNIAREFIERSFPLPK